MDQIIKFAQSPIPDGNFYYALSITLALALIAVVFTFAIYLYKNVEKLTTGFLRLDEVVKILSELQKKSDARLNRLEEKVFRMKK